MHTAVPSTSRNRAVNVVSAVVVHTRAVAGLVRGADPEHERRVGREADVDSRAPVSTRTRSCPTPTIRPTTRPSEPNVTGSPRCMQSRTMSASRGRAPSARARRATTAPRRHATPPWPSRHRRTSSPIRADRAPSRHRRALHCRPVATVMRMRRALSLLLAGAARRRRDRRDRAERDQRAGPDQRHARTRAADRPRPAPPTTTRTACSTCTSSTARSTSAGPEHHRDRTST